MGKIIHLFKPKPTQPFFQSKTENQKITELVENLEKRHFSLEQDSSYLRNSTCYLCKEQITDTPWQLTLRTEYTTESFYLDSLCCDSLLFAANIQTNTNPYCPISQDQNKIKKAHYKPIQISQHNYNNNNKINSNAL